MFKFLEKLLDRNDESKDVITLTTSYKLGSEKGQDVRTIDVAAMDGEQKKRLEKLINAIQARTWTKGDEDYDLPSGASEAQYQITRNGKNILRRPVPTLYNEFKELRDMGIQQTPEHIAATYASEDFAFER